MSPTLTMRPMLPHPSAFERMPDLFSIPEDEMGEAQPPAAARRPPSAPAPARPSTAGADTTAYPMYPGLQTTKTIERTRSIDSFPVALSRPSKITAAASRLSTSQSHESLRARARSPAASWGSGNGYQQPEVASRLPIYRVTQTPVSLKDQRGRRPRLQSMQSKIASLPGEVLEVIFEMVRLLHVEPGSESCATCWMRDATSFALCSRKWSRAARLILYKDIHIVGADSMGHKKRFKTTNQGCRMALLRRTLRADADIASMVRSLKVPAPEAIPGVSSGKGAAAISHYEDNVAALVMACPNLERLHGPMFTYDHSFRRIYHALSTRRKLKEMNWVIESTSCADVAEPAASSPTSPISPTSPVTSSSSSSRDRDRGLSPLTELDADEEIAFLEQHRGWTNLARLSIQCLPDATLAPQTLLARTLTVLPALQHLHLCNLPPNAFTDDNLRSLPRLQSLTLTGIRGISSNGLSALATLASTRPLRRLDLCHTPLTSLAALARLLCNLPSLETFSLVQSFPPLMPESDTFALWMMPYLASASVRMLHWDITSHPDGANAADDILSRSIQSGGFPSLRRLRAPNDPDGIFQNLCRPMEHVALVGDRLRRASISSEPPTSPAKGNGKKQQQQQQRLAKSPTTNSLPGILAPASHTSLVAARLAAQARLDRSREKPVIRVNVTDETGQTVDAFGLGGYLGCVGSPIDYYLLPDGGSSDEKGGLVGVQDLLDNRGEALVAGVDGCTGSWNFREGVVADRREKERWWHTERGRWHSVSL